MNIELQARIEHAFDNRAALDVAAIEALKPDLYHVIALLESGDARVAEPQDGGWKVNEWLKKAVLLYFRCHDMDVMGEPGNPFWDKVPLRFENYDAEDFRRLGARVVPGTVARAGSYIGKDAVLMPSFINIGAHVGAGTMVDTWATVGSCAQIGKNVHLSGGVGIGGVLEPLQAGPVIIEDNCFIGARSEVVEGVIVEEGAVLSMGVFISSTSKIIDRTTGEVFVGRVPAYSVVVPGSIPGKALPDGSPGPNLSCAVIVKRVDAQTRAKTAINDLLRD